MVTIYRLHTGRGGRVQQLNIYSDHARPCVVKYADGRVETADRSTVARLLIESRGMRQWRYRMRCSDASLFAQVEL